MKTNVIISASRDGYAPDQIRQTMTVRELIDLLSDFDEDAKIYLSFDNGYTYGGLTKWKFEEVEEYDEEDFNDEE